MADESQILTVIFRIPWISRYLRVVDYRAWAVTGWVKMLHKHDLWYLISCIITNHHWRRRWRWWFYLISSHSKSFGLTIYFSFVRTWAEAARWRRRVPAYVDDDWFQGCCAFAAGDAVSWRWRRCCCPRILHSYCSEQGKSTQMKDWGSRILLTNKKMWPKSCTHLVAGERGRQTIFFTWFWDNGTVTYFKIFLRLK